MIIGVDEVGRGPLAGPVCVAAFRISDRQWLLREVRRLRATTGMVLRDSKKLTRLARESWVSELSSWRKAGKCDFATCFVHASTIDRIGITRAIDKALSQTLDRLEARMGMPGFLDSHSVLLDGRLRAPARFKKQKTIIKGDEKEAVIALASIVAKVKRDRYMIRLAREYPGYGFENHSGYGTPAHYASIRKLGLSSEHRRSFID